MAWALVGMGTPDLEDGEFGDWATIRGEMDAGKREGQGCER